MYQPTIYHRTLLTQLDLLRAGVHGNKARKLFTVAEWGLGGRLPAVSEPDGIVVRLPDYDSVLEFRVDGD